MLEKRKFKIIFLLSSLVFLQSASKEVVYCLNSGEIKYISDLKIISLAPSITEILYMVGLGNNIIGVTRYDDFPEEVKHKEVIGGYLDIDIEKIIKMKPDLVICEPNSGIKNLVELISSKGIKVIVVDANSVLDILLATEEIGKMFGKAIEVSDLLIELTSRYLHLQRFLKAGNEHIGLIILNENPLIIAGNNSFVGELLGLAGIKNAYYGDSKYPVLDSELLYRMKPDIILNISESVMSGKKSENNVISESIRPFLSDKTHYYNLMDTTFIRPSPRFIDALERLCSLITGYYCF